jgi:hypothetical protein
MQDELLAACQTLLRQGLPSVVPREFDDEHRLIPLGVDINGDVAATAFAWWLPEGARAGRAGLRTSTFLRADGDWAYLGGGVGEFRAYPLAERPPAALQRSYLRPCGYGQTRRGEPRRFLARARYVSHAVFRAAAEVYWLQIGTRVFDVPFHGHAVLVWAARRGPTVIALGADGSRQASMELRRDPFEVRYRRLPLR